jgi:SAM-dependent methyltransferase
LASRCRFKVGDFAETGLPSSSCDAAMSVDALWLVLDKSAAVGEVARILRTQARFIFTTWEFDHPLPGLPEQVDDHRVILADAGFTVEFYEEAFDWKRRQLAVYAGILESEAALVREMGQAVAGSILAEAREVPAYLEHGRRVMVIAGRL